MGFKATDLVPLGLNGPTALTPQGKDLLAKAFVVNRTDTTASVKVVLPGDSSVVDFDIYGVASNAGTTATLSIGSSSASTEFINAQDVKTAGGKIRPTTALSANLPTVENIPVTGDIQIWAKYAETGGASTTGGPYNIIVYYVR